MHICRNFKSNNFRFQITHYLISYETWDHADKSTMALHDCIYIWNYSSCFNDVEYTFNLYNNPEINNFQSKRHVIIKSFPDLGKIVIFALDESVNCLYIFDITDNVCYAYPTLSLKRDLLEVLYSKYKELSWRLSVNYSL